jgi:glycosyltransferase involved in cell wall biosynthesis
MNICLVAQEYPPETARGGIGTQSFNKARALVALGHNVHVLSCSRVSGSQRLRTQQADGVTVHRMQPPGEEPGRPIAVNEPAVYLLGYAWLVAEQLTALHAQERFDVVDFAEYGAEGFVFQLNRHPWEPLPTVVQLHGPLAMFAERIGWPDPKDPLYEVGVMAEGISIRLADALMACSANIADFTADHYSLKRDDINVVHCGVDAAAFRPPAAREGRPMVLFVGNIALNKGIGVVVDAVLRLRHRHPDILLCAAGVGDDDTRDELMSKVKAAGAERNVEFLDFVGREGLARLYQEAHVFASPAEHEVGVANVYIEAMASACPVVACRTGGALEAIVDGESGFLVPPHDVDATARAIDKVLSDADLREDLGNAGRRRVEGYFAMEKYIGRVLASYERAIESVRYARSIAG